jgi:hypothetical protein
VEQPVNVADTGRTQPPEQRGVELVELDWR